MGNHARPSHRAKHRKPPAPYRAAALTASAATATASAGAIVAVATTGHAATVPQAQLAAHVVPGIQAQQLHVVNVTQPPAVQLVTVESGNTLSGIAEEHCGQITAWTGIYMKNKKTIGSNPDLILPGQVLALDCRAVSVPVVTAATSYVRHAKVYAVTPRSTYHRHSSYHAYSYGGGTLSFGQLENLWVAAGGPAWAEYAAARVAECESGGRADAYNPSGATGLWQILGAVRPGDLRNPMANAINAVAKFEASGDTWAQWVCKP